MGVITRKDHRGGQREAGAGAQGQPGPDHAQRSETLCFLWQVMGVITRKDIAGGQREAGAGGARPTWA